MTWVDNQISFDPNVRYIIWLPQLDQGVTKQLCAEADLRRGMGAADARFPFWVSTPADSKGSPLVLFKKSIFDRPTPKMI